MRNGQVKAEPASRDDVAPSIDCVFTWVDDQQPGYQKALTTYAQKKVDRDPSRTRDSLETLRYGLRSIELYAPWIRNIYIFTCRPQVPHWLRLDHPRIKLIHHDQIIPSKYLPTFNSFAIVSYLHKLPGISTKLIYFEDDMMLLRATNLSDFETAQGKLKLYEGTAAATTIRDIQKTKNPKPWNMAVAESNLLLATKFGERVNKSHCHHPMLIDKNKWQELEKHFPQAMEITRQSKFRNRGNIAPEYIYPLVQLADGNAITIDPEITKALTGYVPLENFWPVTAFRFWQLSQKNPLWVTLNDNFGTIPSRTTERMTRKFLQENFPQPSSFER